LEAGVGKHYFPALYFGAIDRIEGTRKSAAPFEEFCGEFIFFRESLAL